MRQTLWTHTIIALAIVMITSCGTDQAETDDRIPEKIEFPTVDYTISPSIDTTIFGPQGTRIFIGSNTFQFTDGSPATDSITIELKEFYNKADIILADLSTMSDEGLLETGGMIYLNVTSNGQELEIKEDKKIVVHFPKERDDYRNMNLFYADETATDSSVTNWEIDTVDLVKQVAKLGGWGYQWVTHEDSTEFEFMPKNFVDSGYYWNPVELYVNTYDFSSSTLKEISECTDPFGVNTEFNININGRIKNPKVKSKISKSATKEIIEFLLQLPEFEPGKNNKGEIIERLGLIDIETEIVRAQKTDVEYIQSFDSKYAKFENQPIKNMNDAELNYYVFSISKLGWINCDRFMDIEETVDLLAQIPVVSDTKLKMAFSDIDGVLMANIVDGKYVFPQVPKGRKVTIIGIKNKNGQFLTAFKEFTISDEAINELTFKETTLTELRTKLEKI